MKKVFGFFTDKTKKNKFLKWVLITLLILVLSAGGISIAVFAKKGTSLLKISKNLNTYDMQLTYNADHTITANQSLSLTNRSENAWDIVSFNLYANAFAEGVVNKPVSSLSVESAYPNGLSYGGISIASVTINNKQANYECTGTDSNVLNVVPQTPLKAGSKTQIQMEYTLTLPNVNHRFGYGENAINVANFYPVLAVYENGEFICDPYNYNGDPFYSDLSNYNVELTVLNTMVVAHTGNQVSVESGEQTKTLTINALAVRDFAFVLSEKFTLIESNWEGINIKYFYYADQNASQSLQAGVDSIKTYSELFGMYPYSTYSVVQTNFVHGGMEYPNLVYISDQVDITSDYINVIVHETAHQWWYSVVGSNAYRNAWLDEGLTEFSTVLFYENNPTYNVNSTELITNATQSYVSFIELCESVLGEVNTTMNRALNEYDTEPEYVYMTYVKGMLLFENLRSSVGNANFDRALKNYYQEYQFKNATPDNLVQVFETTCLRDLEGFFNSWTQGKVLIKNFA